MSSLQEEILSLKKSLNQLEEERRNLIKHFQIQEDNYFATFKLYEEKVDLLLKQKDDKIEELLKQNCLLEAKIVGEIEEGTVTVLQYKF